jgi:hypothetical protein
MLAPERETEKELYDRSAGKVGSFVDADFMLTQIFM